MRTTCWRASNVHRCSSSSRERPPDGVVNSMTTSAATWCSRAEHDFGRGRAAVIAAAVEPFVVRGS
jgi:hypothetical protein